MLQRAVVDCHSFSTDGSKMGRPAMIEIGPLKAVHTVVTDTPPDAVFERLFRDWGFQCVVASSA